MTDDIKYRIVLTVTDSGLQKLTSVVGQLNQSLNYADKSLNTVEKDLAKAGASASGAAGGVNQLNKSLAETTAKAGSASSATNVTSDAFAGLANTRYALYDVATTLGVISTATLGLSVAAIKTEADFEQLFASAQRTSQTSGSQWDELKTSLIDLTTQMPITAEAVSQIATLGGQLGIEAQNIDAFTESTAKFAATTDVSAQSAAEGLGRLAQLTGVGQTSFDELTSSIYQVGVTSVATESAVLAVSTQISVSARQAGFAADQTIALAGALASLGVAPERARGSIQRTFNIITNAADNGGAVLEKFASISGVTADEFAQTWKGDPQTAFQEFLAGLGRADKAGQNMNNILSDVGITAVRDTDALKRLAQNTDVYADSIAQANQGWNDGSAFANGYAVQTETLNAKLQVLGQTLQAILEGAQNNAFLKQMVDILQALASTLLGIARSPVGKFFVALAIGLGLVVGSLAAIAGGVALAQASMLALITVTRALTKEQQEQVGTLGLAKAALVQYAVATGRVTQAEAEAMVATKGLTGSMRLLGTTTKATSIAMKGALAATVVGAAFVGVGLVLEHFTTQAEAAKAAKQELDASFKDAIMTDVQAFQDAGGVLKELPSDLDATGVAADTAGQKARDYAESQLVAGTSTDTASTAVADQTLKLYDLTDALGAATDAAVGKSILDLALGDSTNGQDQLKQFNLIATGLSNIGVTWAQVKQAVESNNVDFITDLDLKAIDDYNAASASYAVTLSDADLNAMGAAQAVMDFSAGLGITADSLDTTKTAAQTFGAAQKELGIVINSTGDEEGQQQEQTKSLADGLFDGANASIGMTNSMYALGQQLADTGGGFDTLTKDGAANMGAFQDAVGAAAKLAGDDSDLFISLVDNIIQQMVNAGVTGVQQLIQVRNQYAQITGGQPTAISDIQAGVLMSNQLAKGMHDAAKETDNVAKNANKAAKAIRTLKDYVNDLSSVIKAAFDYRFGFTDASDNATTAARKITEGFADAAQKVRDLSIDIQELQSTLLGLASDKSILEFQLTVAQEYNDTLGAQKIQAKLAENAAKTAKANAELTDKQKDVTKAQEDATATATGNSDAAIEQRSNIEDLVQKIDDQVTAYAAQGHSVKDTIAYAKKLKSQLYDQLKAWGYSTAEAKRYTAAIDDVVKILGKIPRNLTTKVDADTSPAQKALDEFFAKNKDKTINTTHNITTKNKTSNDPVGQQVSEINAKINALIASLKAGNNNPNLVKYVMPQIKALEAQRKKLVGYAGGGYTGPGGKYEPAGVVHRGEYVIESERVGRLGVPFLNALGRSTERGYASGGPVSVSASVPGSMMVELSPTDRRLLRESRISEVYIDGKKVTAAVNSNNAVTGSRGIR